MDFWTARSERTTAIVSTLVAIAILAGGVTAFQSHHAPVDDVVQLESDLRFQLEVAFRHDPNERARRLVLLEEVTQAWLQSPRSTADREQLASWLLEATIRSMPGSIEKLPVAPKFGESTPQPLLDQQRPDVLVETPLSEQIAEEPIAEEPEKSKPVLLEPTPASLAPIERITPVTEIVAPIADELLATPQPTTTPAQVMETPIRINLTELAARIAGYHEGLDEIDATMLIIEPANIVALLEQIRLLEELSQDFRFIRLYYQTLTDRERRAVAEPRSMAATLAKIERRIDHAQEALSGDFLGEFDTSHQGRFGALRQRLTAITAATK
ncbi:MAG: hypothetical protein GXP24_13665 [Planctomycetes bacterium]|nr:hypothetical protein [Planctomycetota bacterium]